MPASSAPSMGIYCTASFRMSDSAFRVYGFRVLGVYHLGFWGVLGFRLLGFWGLGGSCRRVS